MPTVSVIIPTFNRAAALPRALTSVLSQTVPVDEIIVVDDGSTDGTSALVAQSAWPVRLLAHTQCRGVSAARNAGIAAARSEWIALLDSDDVWLPHKVERQLAAAARSPSFDVIHSDEVWVRNGRRVNAPHRYTKRGGRIFQACLPLCAISPSTVMVRRRVFAEIGLFDEDLPACEDYDLWLRVCARFEVLYVDEPLIEKHGGHPDQLSMRHAGMDRFRVRALMKILDQHVLPRDDEAAARQAIVAKCRIYGEGARKRGRHTEAEHYSKIAERYG